MTAITFKGAPWWKAELTSIGADGAPLLIIDDFFPHPDILLKDAAKRSFTANAPYYPGIRANTPQAYFHPLMTGLSEVFLKIFKYTNGIDLQECHYSLVTTLGKNLNMVQRIPHVDGGNNRKVALLHYLCGAEHGGTSFYKHNRTGFETIKKNRFQKFNDAVHEDHHNFGPSKAEYYSGQDARFSKIHDVEAKFNRSIIYYGHNLHSINIPDDRILSSDVKTGRLTINSFFNPL